MNKSIDKMAGISNTDKDLELPSSSDVDDFERMLNDFISKEFDDEIIDAQQDLEEIQKNNNSEENISLQYNEPKSNLHEHEFSLLRAYSNFMYSISSLCDMHNLKTPQTHITEASLYPRFKPRIGYTLSQDIFSGWEVLIKIFPETMQKISPDSSDDQLLDFAERCEDENMQLAVISYVETMIELEGCEIDYEARKIKYKRKQLEKLIYEEHQRRVNRAKSYIKAIQEKNFPIDAERLVNNYFRLSNKDPEGSFKALTTNPATFAPIDFSKIKDHFFGLIKVKPQDGIRINQKLGNFLKKLKA